MKPDRCQAKQGGTVRKIGITGGVGCGKSTVLDFLRGHTRCRILKSDEAARALEEPGGICYAPMIALLEEYRKPGDGILVPEKGGPFDRAEAARRIYRSAALRARVDALIHPAVIRFILQEMEAAEEEGVYDYFFLEAALLIENGFLKFVDEMWYIYCSEEIRRARLRASRGYSDDKMDAMMRAQLSDAEFRKYCDIVIDNSGTAASMERQVMDALGRNRRFRADTADRMA